MMKKRLSNGLRIIIEKRPTKSVVIDVVVGVGSNFETRKNNGISHFVEHCLFNGTRSSSAKDIANAVEKFGGELNGYTSDSRTGFYVKISKKHIDTALRVLADIIQNPLFNNKGVKKEKNIILNEVKLIKDEPRFFQWLVFKKTLFKKHSARLPITGNINSIKKIKRQNLFIFHKKNYLANNMVVSIVGSTDKKIFSKVKKHFCNIKKGKVTQKIFFEPKQKTVRKKVIKRDVLQSYVVLGYKTQKRAHKDSYVFDVIRAILDKGQSGWLFEEIRTKRGLVYEIGVNHEAEVNFGFFAVYYSTAKENINKVKDLILKEFEKLQKTTEKELREAQENIEGQFILQNEDNFKAADNIAFWELAKECNLYKNYVKKIKSVKINDIKRVAKEYLTKKYAMSVISG